MSEPRLPWRVGESIISGRYSDAVNALLTWASQTLADAPLHFAIEFVLILFVVGLVLKRRQPTEPTLDPKDVDELVESWEPEPLYSEKEKQAEADFPLAPEVERYAGPYLTVNGKDLLNFGSFGFLGLSSNAEVKEVAKAGVRKFGVGSCGPRGFYGTFDVHLQLEQDLARFFGSDDAVVFSSNYATISSTVPCFAKRGDYVICDKGVSHALQTGVLLSRCNARWFSHNDPQDLERVLQEVKREQQQLDKKWDEDKPQQRTFVLIEGLYPNYGDIAPLDKIVDLKVRKGYKFRIILDDSLALGVLGKTGRGTLEHYQLPLNSVDILTGSLANTLGSVGGFLVARKEVVAHSRLNSTGYVFSASSPPYLLMAASKALELTTPEAVQLLARNVQVAREALEKTLKQDALLAMYGHEQSPVIHLRLARVGTSRTEDGWLLQRISEHAAKNGVAVPRARYVDGEKYQPPPSLRFCVTSVLSEDQIRKAVAVIAEAARSVLQK